MKVIERKQSSMSALLEDTDQVVMPEAPVVAPGTMKKFTITAKFSTEVEAATGQEALTQVIQNIGSMQLSPDDFTVKAI